MCDNWVFELLVDEPHIFDAKQKNSTAREPFNHGQFLAFEGREKLFPRRETPVTAQRLSFFVVNKHKSSRVTAKLFVGSAQPVIRQWTIEELVAKSVQG